MEIGITAPVSGRVRDVFVARNVQVDAGAPLLRIEPVADDAADVAGGGARRSRRAAALAGGDEPLEHAGDRCEAFLLGFDVDARRGRRLLARGDRRLGADRAPPCVAELEILEAFSRPRCCGPRAARPDADGDTRTRPASTSTPTCARSTSSAKACRSGSSTTCSGRSPTTASTTLDRSPELEAALLRLFASQQRRAEQLPDRAGPARRPARPAGAERRRRTDACATCSTGSSTRPSGATRRSPACRATRPVPPLRPAAHRTRPRRGRRRDAASSPRPRRAGRRPRRA